MSSLRIVCWFLVQALMSACLLPSVEQRSHNDTGTIPPLMTGPTSNAATAPAGDAGGDSTHHTPSQPPGSPDCSAAACSMKDQVCDTQNSACVDCLADEHCKTGQICEANSKKCMGCRDDSDCRTGELRTCNTQTATCVECLEGRTSTGCQRHDRPACWGQRCVECSQDSDCATTTLTRPLCRTETHACVECNSDRDCTRPNASHCNDMTHTCEPCTALEQCKHVPGLTECDTKSRKCVECVDGGRACGSEAGLTVCDAKMQKCVECVDGGTTCGGKACLLSTHKCSTVPAGSRGLCQECQSSTECQSAECVQITSGIARKDEGGRCLLPRARATCDRPTTQALNNMKSVDGLMVSVCAPTPITSCAALVDAMENKPCSSAGSCGWGVGDGACHPNTKTCTLGCDDLDDCPNPKACMSGRCE